MASMAPHVLLCGNSVLCAKKPNSRVRKFGSFLLQTENRGPGGEGAGIGDLYVTHTCTLPMRTMAGPSGGRRDLA